MTQRPVSDPCDGLVHLNRPSGEPRPGARAMCGADHRLGVSTTYSLAWVTCEACCELKVLADPVHRTTDSIEEAA